MNELYPIIRRQRRPLVETNAEMLKPEMLKTETVPAVVTPPVETVAPVATPKVNHDQTTAKRNAR